MTTYAGRYGSGPQVKPGSLTLALAATALPVVVLVAGLQITQSLRKPGVIETWNVPKELPPPPPDTRLKEKPKDLPDEKLYVAPVPTPVLPQTPLDVTPDKLADPAPQAPIGKAPDPAPPAQPEPVPVKPPVIVGAVASMGTLQPPYPPDMIRGQQEGKVVVRVLVGADGRVKQVEKVSATNDSFYGATERQALTRWKFKPATKDGVPFEQWKTMSLRFVLDDQ